MRSKAILVALLALAFGGVEAAPVSLDQATSLVRAWASSKATMGEKFASSAVRLTKEHRTPGGVKFYTVHLADGGVALTSADTEIEPIIAFTSASEIEESDQNPLWVLINRDIEVRHAALELTKSPVKMAAATAAGVSATALTTSVTKMATAAERKWAAFLADGPVVPRSTSVSSAPTAAAPNRKDTMKSSDIYVSPMVKTKWSQGAAKGQPCYNRFTPKNYVCGCTATATAQLMRFFAFPTGEVPAGTRTCKVDGVNTELDYGGYAYKWDLMPDVPENATYNAEAWDEIGHLTRDAGVLLESTYTAGAGSAYVQDIPDVLKFYGYKNAVCYYDYATESGALGPGGDGRVHDDTGLHNTTTRRNVILSNLDAGLPVVLGIQGYTLGHVGDENYQSGHAIVADGYGFVSVDGEQTEYIHLNMGWAGSDDAWYNTPEIMTDKTGAHAADSGFDFTVLSAAAYNVFTNATGELLSGRVTYEDGTPAAGIIVSAGGKETVTGAGGTYGLILPANGTYDVSARSADGTYEGEAKGISLGRSSYDAYYGTAKTGNSWGHWIILNETAYENSVQIVRTQEKFGALDAALDAAQSGDTVEILSQTVLRFPQAITKNVTIRTVAGADLEEVFVNCRDRARNGFTNVTARLSLENVKFHNTKGCFVNVAADGTLTVSGRIGLDGGVDGDTFIQTVSKDSLALAGALSADTFITVDCAGAKARNEAFGTFTCDDASASASASHFLNPFDPELGGVAKTDGSKQLVWDNVPVDPGRAIAYYTGDGGASGEYYLTLHKIFAEHTSGDVVILRDCVETDTKDNRLKGPVEITGAMRILCTNETAATVAFSNDISIVIAAGGSLSVSNLVFTGAEVTEGVAVDESVVVGGAFVMNGGDLTLESGTVIEDCDNEVDLDVYSGAGAVTVLGGTLTMKSGATIRNCETTYGCGGGVYVECLYGDALFEMTGGSIENCLSEGYGGGAYIDRYAGMTLSGDATLTGSSSRAASVPSDNLYLATPENLELVDELNGLVYLRCGGEECTGGDPFALIADACSLVAASNSAAYFRSDDYPETWHGAVGENGATLVWSDEVVPIPQPPLEYPVAWVIYAQDDGTSVTNEFASLDEALQSIQGDATVVVNAVGFPDDPDYGYELPEEVIAQITSSVPYLTKDVMIRDNVVIKTEDTDDGFINTICRKGYVSVTVADGGSLTLTNICFEGMFPEFEVVTNDVPAPLLHCKGWQTGGDDTMIRVREGGELVMAGGSGIYDVVGSAERDSCAVSVMDGMFTMEDGAEIADCENTWKDDQNLQKSPAGGVIVSGPDAIFSLKGGSIFSCTARMGGGVLVENSAQMEISGDPFIEDNYLTDGKTSADLSVSREATEGQTGELVLVGEFTGSIGILEPRLYETSTEAASVDTNVFGRVAEGLDLPALRPSAAKFFRNAAPGVTGLIVTNDTEALLVWTSAVDEDGIYRDKDGNEYKVVEDPPAPTEIDPPTAVKDLIYNGNEQTGVVEADGYTLTGNKATNAGDYTATVTLRSGYVWKGGSTDPLQIDWSIAKATYDMSGVTFEGASFEADGSPKSIYISGDLPAGVSVSYEGNGQTAPGSYTVTAKFTGDQVNYEPIDDKTAMLTITKKEDPDPQWDIITNHPGPIAFKSIDRIADTEWKLVITNRVEYCNYRLLWTTDLTKGFTSTGAWEHAVGPAAEPVWTTNVITTGGAWFWRAEGADGTNMVPHVEK